MTEREKWSAESFSTRRPTRRCGPRSATGVTARPPLGGGAARGAAAAADRPPGRGAEFTPPFWCGYGYNISAGEGFYPNHNVWMGAGRTVLAGAEIGDNSVIGAGSVGKGRIPPSVVAAGVPCRVLRRLED